MSILFGGGVCIRTLPLGVISSLLHDSELLLSAPAIFLVRARYQHSLSNKISENVTVKFNFGEMYENAGVKLIKQTHI